MADRPRADRARAGFMLVEVLIALVIAGLALSVVGRALSDAWRNTRVPAEILTAVTLAQADLSRGPGDRTAGEPPRGFTITRRTSEVDLLDRPDDVAPAPLRKKQVVAARPGPVANDVMPGVTEHPEAGGGRSGQLQRLGVTVRTPGGRLVAIETVRLDAAPN